MELPPAKRRRSLHSSPSSSFFLWTHLQHPQNPVQMGRRRRRGGAKTRLLLLLLLPSRPQFLTLFVLISLSVAGPSSFLRSIPPLFLRPLNGNSRQSFCGTGRRKRNLFQSEGGGLPFQVPTPIDCMGKRSLRRPSKKSPPERFRFELESSSPNLLHPILSSSSFLSLFFPKEKLGGLQTFMALDPARSKRRRRRLQLNAILAPFSNEDRAECPNCAKCP